MTRKDAMPETTPLITLQDAKDHLRVDTDDEDSTIQLMVDAAIEYVTKALNNGPLDGATAPKMAKSAALLMVGSLFEHREATTTAPLRANATVDNLIAMCRNYEGFIQ